MNDVLGYLERESKQPLSLCYQCQKCSGGCPVSKLTTVMAHQVVRLAQQDQVEALIAAPLVWYCTGCKTCQARCPNGIDISAVLDVLKAKVLSEANKVTDLASFHTSFLNSVQRHGRVYELGMVVGYKWRVKRWLEDKELGSRMFLKGKLALLPHRIAYRRQVKDLFRLQARGGREDD